MKIKTSFLKIIRQLLWIGSLFCSTALFSQELPVLRVGTSADFPPFSFMENGKHTGFDIELVQEIAKHLNYSVEIINMPFSTILAAIQLGNIDVIAAGLTETKERSKQVLFLPQHLKAVPYIILTKNIVLSHGISDLNGKEVVVNDGYTAAEYMKGFPEVHLQYLKSPADALVALDANRAFAFVTAKNTISDFLKNHPRSQEYNLYIITNTGDSASLAVSKKKPELHAEMEKILLTLLADGTVEKLKQKWGL